MNVVIRKIGNSEGVIIPKELLDRLGLKAGDELSVLETSGGLQLSPTQAELTEQLKAARSGMKKYRVALRELAK